MKPAVIILVLALCLAGCERGGERSRTPVLFLAPPEEGRAGRPSERLFQDGQAGYRLKRAITIRGSGQALVLRYKGAGGERALRVYGEDGLELVSRPLVAAPGNTVVLYAPLPQGSRMQGFQILSAPDSDAGSFMLLGAEIAGSFSGAALYPGELHLGSLVRSLTSDGRAVELRFSLTPGDVPAAAAASAGGPLWQIELEIESLLPVPQAALRRLETAASTDRPDPGLYELAQLARTSRYAIGRAEVALTFSGQGRRRCFRHSALSGKHRLFIYPGMMPFVPETLKVEPLGDSRLWLERFAVAWIPNGAGSAGGRGGGPRAALDPLPADPGAVLLYDPARWRQQEYELFSWQRYPEILIMDTFGYAVQSRFFKRLAFFVEKRGYRGRLVTDEEFAALHGFNAHDYRAEDLARFFQIAREQSFPLNPEEELLEKILLANGIIRERGTILPGRGGILSISRSSTPLLRRNLLTHECLHGLFFALSEYRRAGFEAWERLSEEARAYWELFFRWVGYDTDDPYLAVNEFQAYLLQQPRDGVDYYFRSLTAARLISSYPEREQRIRLFLAAEPDGFRESFDDLERALRDLAGIEGGRVVELEPVEAGTAK